MPNDIFFIFLGAILTLLSTALIEYWKNYRDRKEKKNNFLLIVKLGLISLQKTLQKLRLGFDYINSFEMSTLSTLSKNLRDLESLQRETYYFSNPNKQEKLIDLISELTIFTGELKVIEEDYAMRLEKLNNKLNSQYRELIEGVKTGKNQAVKTDDEAISDTQKKILELMKSIPQVRKDKIVDLIDIKRRVDEFIKSLDD